MTKTANGMDSTRCAWRNLRLQNRKWIPKWDTFEGFLADMGPRPSASDKVLVARDAQKPWGKANCYWGPRYKACVNHRRARIITWKGTSTSIGDWGRTLNVKPGTIVSRLYRGWKVGEALKGKKSK
jgi:hypothetical protein